MAFIPRSSNQFHCYRFRLRFVKRKRRSGSPRHLKAAAKHHEESVSRPRLRTGLLPFLEGNRDFLRFRTYARDQADCELSAHLEPLLLMYPKTKVEWMYSSPVLRS